MALEIGQRVGEYEILAPLGVGGMGQVYSVRNVISGRVEAIKVLLPDFDAEAEVASRFTVEIRTLAALDHPNIAQLRTAFEYENQLVMVMEFVEGTTLEKLPGARPMPVSDAINYSIQVLAALTYAHSKGVTHRDIKPANIMVTSHGLVKLMDFGVARSSSDPHLTRPGSTVGSLHYMSPEQVRGGIVDARSDIYSFGVTLYQIVTGRQPFQGENAYDVLTAQINQIPTSPSQLNPTIPAGLNEAVLRAMAKAPEERFQTADAFRQALVKVQAGSQTTASMTVPVITPPPPITAPASAASNPSFAPMPAAIPHSKSRPGLWIGLGAAAALVAVILAITLLPHFWSANAGQKAAAPVTNADPPSPSKRWSNAAPPRSAAADSPAPKTTADAAQQPTIPAQPFAAAAPSLAANVRTPALPNAPSTAPASDPQASGPSRQEIDQARTRLIDVDARAEAVRSSVEGLRAQQQAQGLGLRTDMAASLSRLNSYLGEAHRDLDENDVQAAAANMDRAEKELSTLQAFFGR